MTGIQLRTGVDLVDVPRLQHLIATDPSFLLLAYTSGELTHCAGLPDRLAGRWAVKEAVMKALGAGIGRLSPTDIEVLVDTNGAPMIQLQGAARRRADALGVSGWSVSLSHEGGLAVAFVVGVIGGEIA